MPLDHKAEWLEADGLGGFASGTVAGIRTRRYHGLLLAATTPPTGRLLLVNGFDAWVATAAGSFALSSQLYTPGVTAPDGAGRIEAFEIAPWPRWKFRLEDGTRIEQEIFVPKGSPTTAVSWRLVAPVSSPVVLSIRPFLSGRDYHALHRENPVFRSDANVCNGRVLWHPYPGVPAILAWSNGEYIHAPLWYRNFLYEEERLRGLDFTEDLASPGVFRFDLCRGEAIWLIAVGGSEPGVRASSAVVAVPQGGSPRHAGAGASLDVAALPSLLEALRNTERRRRDQFPSFLHRSADAYIVRRAKGKTIVAGYPWFTDWGRDTFIALRGLCLSTGRGDVARDILIQWAGTVSQGMLPNRFPDCGETPEFNSVDASLWFVIAVHDLFQAEPGLSRRERRTLQSAVEAILAGYAGGTRYGIRLDEDGLLAAGEPGVQLTWMDAKIGDWVVTPRIGKPVEVQALWLNALRVGSTFSKKWKSMFDRGAAAFERRFWNEAGGYLYDVVDSNHQAGTVDATFRPNQIFAIGGLPLPLLKGSRARRVVDAVEERLLTPLGLRSLAASEPGYCPRYEGDVVSRDRAYHQGTVWPWLMGPFVEAWVRVRAGTAKGLREAKAEARARFLDPLLRNLDQAGLGHISEIADGDPPHTPRGCPFQSWSLGEALRLKLVVLAGAVAAKGPRHARIGHAGAGASLDVASASKDKAVNRGRGKKPTARRGGRQPGCWQ